MQTLNEIRNRINDIDDKIKQLFLERMELAEKVADCKLYTNDKVLKPERELELINMMSENVSQNVKNEYISMLKTTIRVSRMHQYKYMLEKKPEKLEFHYSNRNKNPQTVVYQGLPASYQSQAARAMFPDAEIISHVESFEDVFKAVSDGKAEIGVVPIENSSIGTINEVCDLLMKYDLYISHSHINDIRHCLVGCKGATIDSVKQVYSIKPALDQCKNYLSEKGFELCKASNTAVAAQDIQKWNDITKAAVCSEDAAKLYGLDILMACINDDKTNQTRFVAISKNLSASENDNRVSIAFTLPHKEGTLSATLSMFSDRNINLTEIHSRPLEQTPWNYRFYADFEGSLANEDTRSLIYQLSEELSSFRLLGSYQITKTSNEV